MLVYGDHSQRVDPASHLDELVAEAAQLRRLAPGLVRHSRLVGLLIEGGRHLQCVADAEFDRTGEDGRSSASDAMSYWLRQVAEAVCTSWRSHFHAELSLPDPPRSGLLPDRATLKLPEGFAFYSVYPEAFADAASKLQLRAPPRVIGIRSIGTTLGSIVAAALAAPPPVTVRPFGDPSARRIAMAPELEQELLGGPAHFVIVDEGPGQSGSSFGAVADWLEARGVPAELIAFVTSHPAPPGPRASDAHRRRWTLAQRAVGDIGPRLPELLERWTAELLGPLDEPPVEISAGEWRRSVFAGEQEWPAVNPGWERRKYLVAAGGDTWLVKFAGLGAIGARKLQRARQLHAAGLAPRPIGLVHGFLVERWHGDALRLQPGEKPLPQLARYIGNRARLPLRDIGGATIRELFEMAQCNIGLAVGEDVAEALSVWEPRIAALERRASRIATDNALGRHEWLRLPDGQMLKCDAIDHCEGHDLIGAQDMAWDVAGCAVEFGLDVRETGWLAARAGRAAGRLVDPELLQFSLVAYLSFALGRALLAAEMCANDPREEDRWTQLAGGCRQRLRELLLVPHPSCANRLDSSLDAATERTASGTIVERSG